MEDPGKGSRRTERFTIHIRVPVICIFGSLFRPEDGRSSFLKTVVHMCSSVRHQPPEECSLHKHRLKSPRYPTFLTHPYLRHFSSITLSFLLCFQQECHMSCVLIHVIAPTGEDQLWRPLVCNYLQKLVISHLSSTVCFHTRLEIVFALQQDELATRIDPQRFRDGTMRHETFWLSFWRLNVF
jgi:hypothetical protein